MENRILGLHHITAIATSAKRNYDFYTKVLGLRFIKKTVNFDDPKTYHFYYGNEEGTPGTILTFFPWESTRSGRLGTGMATEISYSVPAGSFDFWQKRFEENKVKYNKLAERFGEQYIHFEDPDGLQINLIVPKETDNRKPWTTGEVNEQVATKGFHSVTLTLENIHSTAKILTDVFGYTFLKQENNRHRFITDAVEDANIVDLVETPGERPGFVAGGTNHHVAFRVKDDDILMTFREKVERHGLDITEKIDRNYFFSLYFREPGGVIFELASNNPGFSVDEPVNELGTHLKLPPQYEPMRSQLEEILIPLD
ncbi:MAG TPA: ring-cleaving dioxygenase [Chitinophagaceae bacterium]|jgi:glyoxalase family protein